MILALLFMSGVVAANQDVVASWLVNERFALASSLIPFVPISNASLSGPLYVGVTGFQGAFMARDAVVEVISANKTTRIDSIFMTGTYTTGTVQLAPREDVYLHVHTTNPEADFYDEWYHVIVGQNQPVMRLRPGLGTQDAPAPLGGFDEDYYGRMVRYSTGSAWYWQITPTFFLAKRDEINDAGALKINLLNPDGMSIRNVTGLSSSSGTPDSAAADFIARSSQFSLNLSVDLGYSFWNYGRPMLFLGPPPDYSWRIGYLVIWVSFNTTDIRASYLTSRGWTLLNYGLTPGYLSFYRVLPPISANGVTDSSAIYDIPVDTGNLPSGTGISLRVWMADLQLPADAARGVSDSVPLSYGGVSGYGITQTIFANGFVIGSNKPTGQLIWTAFKTA